MRTPALLLIGLSLACGHGARQADAIDSLPATVAPGITAVTLERTPCFGSSPDYRVRFDADGTAGYHGGRFAPRKGEYRATLALDEFHRLTARFDTLGFFALDSVYSQNVTDLPTYILTASTAGGDRSVRCYGFGCPKAFHELAALVDTLTDQLHWDSLPPAP